MCRIKGHYMNINQKLKGNFIEDMSALEYRFNYFEYTNVYFLSILVCPKFVLNVVIKVNYYSLITIHYSILHIVCFF